MTDKSTINGRKTNGYRMPARKRGAIDDDTGAAIRRVIDDPLFDCRDMDEKEAREAAKVMSGIAISKGAKSATHDDELDPCGLDEVMDALFGHLPIDAEHPYKGKVVRQLGTESVNGLSAQGGIMQ